MRELLIFNLGDVDTVVGTGFRGESDKVKDQVVNNLGIKLIIYKDGCCVKTAPFNQVGVFKAANRKRLLEPCL